MLSVLVWGRSYNNISVRHSAKYFTNIVEQFSWQLWVLLSLFTVNPSAQTSFELHNCVFTAYVVYLQYSSWTRPFKTLGRLCVSSAQNFSVASHFTQWKAESLQRWPTKQYVNHIVPPPPAVLSLHWTPWSLCYSLYTGHSCFRVFTGWSFCLDCPPQLLASQTHWLVISALTSSVRPTLTSLCKLQLVSFPPALIIHCHVI